MTKTTLPEKMQHPQGLYSLAPGYNICILRVVILVICLSRSRAIRRPVFAPSVLTLQAVTVVLWEVNGACNIHSRIQPCPSDIYVFLSNKFSHLKREAFYTCGKLDGHIDEFLHMLGTMYRWCVAAVSSGLCNIPTPVDQVLGVHVVQIDALCEQRSRPNSIQGRNPGTCCTCRVTRDHREPSACSRTQIMCASGQATMTPLSTATLVS